MDTGTGRALCLAIIIVTLPACSVSSPLLRPPPGRFATEVSRDMADCEAASTPGVGTYAEAAGQGLLARIASPLVGIVALVGGGRAQPAPPPGVPDTRGDGKGAVLTAAGMGAVAGIVAGPFVGYHVASEAVRDARQERFERCLLTRGYQRFPPPRPPLVLVLVAADTTRPGSVQAFRGELERRGYIFGQTLEVELQWWEDPQASGVSVLAKRWDIVVAGSGEIAVAVHRTLPETAIILAASELDPVASGLAASAEHPWRNVSGLTLAAAKLNSTRLELLVRALPHLTRVAVLANPDNAEHAISLETLAAVAAQVIVQRVDVRTESDLDEIVRGLARDGIGALLVLPDPALRRRLEEIASLARRESLPTVGGDIGFADAGGLLEYHPSLEASWREAAAFVDRVLKGAAVGSLPIRTVPGHDLVVNLKTAEALGLTLSTRVLLSATRVIR
jgi:putative ABC transport system substrate-binding protein